MSQFGCWVKTPEWPFNHSAQDKKGLFAHVCVFVVRASGNRGLLPVFENWYHKSKSSKSTSRTVNTHIVLPEVLDGSVHVLIEKWAADLTHWGPKWQADHCPHHSCHHIKARSTPVLLSSHCSPMWLLVFDPCQRLAEEGGRNLEDNRVSLALKLAQTVRLVMKALDISGCERECVTQLCSNDLGVKIVVYSFL